jgi:hypothetical protein
MQQAIGVSRRQTAHPCLPQENLPLSLKRMPHAAPAAQLMSDVAVLAENQYRIGGKEMLEAEKGRFL